MSETAEKQADLVVLLPEGDALLDYFLHQEKMGPTVIDPVKQLVDDFHGDVTTDKGRKEIKSFAHKIKLYKGKVGGIGDEVAREQKKVPGIIDATRNFVKVELEKLEKAVREPLDQWEADESARVARHGVAIDQIRALFDLATDANVALIRERIELLDTVHIDETACEDFVDEYRMAHKTASERLSAALAGREKYEAEQTELADLRRERAQREAADAAAAAELAAAEAERRRVEEEEVRLRLAAEQAAQAAREQAAREAAAVESRLQAEREAAAAREAELARQAAEAEQRARETEARVRREAEEARQREADEKAARESDRAHRGKVNREAAAAFVAGGISPAIAKAVVELIAKGQIPSITINY